MMNTEDLQLEDIVLLQLFKDQIMSCGLDQSKGTGCVERTPSSHQADFAELEKALAELKPGLPESHPLTRLANFTGQPDQDGCSGPTTVSSSLPRDLPTPRRNRTGGSGSGSERPPRLGKDEKLAKEAGIPFNVKTLIALPMDEFNDLLSKNDLTEEQLNICRDIRRRGKNKVAAQNCRQRKIDQIEELHSKLARAVARRDKLRYEHERLISLHAVENARLNRLTEAVLSHHSKDSSSWSIQVVGDEVTLQPKTEIKEEDCSSQGGGNFQNGLYPGRQIYSHYSC